MKNKITSNLLFLSVIIAVTLSVLTFGCKQDNQINPSEINENITLKSLQIILSPQNITDVTGRFFVENQATPKNVAYMSIRWQDDINHPGNAISVSPSYNPATFTGYTPPMPLTSWQRGEYDDSVNGSPVFQLNGTYGGMLMNSWFTTYQVIVGGGQNTTYAYEFLNPSTPWNTSTSVLWVQGDLKLPWFANWDNNSNDNFPVGQLSYFIYLKDISINKALCIIINAYDNRTVPLESVQNDTYTYFASTRFGGTKYSTPNSYSASWRNTTWNTYNFYRAEITRQNIVNIATDVNTQFGQNFSINPNDYQLTSAGILQETFREQGDQVSMGSSFRDFCIYKND